MCLVVYFHCTLFSYNYISTSKKHLNQLEQLSIYHYDNNFYNEVFQNCSSLVTNRFKAIIIRDRSFCIKYLEPLNTLNCGIGGDIAQNVVWWTQNLPVISNLKIAAVLFGTSNLFQDPPEEIADGIIKILQTFQSNYNSINIAIGGILPRDASGSISWVLAKQVNEILKAKCSKSLLIYISKDSFRTFANSSLNTGFFVLDSMHLVQKWNLKLAVSILSSIENCSNVTCN